MCVCVFFLFLPGKCQAIFGCLITNLKHLIMQLFSLPGTFAHLTLNVLLSTVLNSSHCPFFTHNGEPSFTFTLCTLKITIEVLQSLMISVVPSP